MFSIQLNKNTKKHKRRRSANNSRQNFLAQVVITAITFYFTFSDQPERCATQSKEKLGLITYKTYSLLEISQAARFNSDVRIVPTGVRFLYGAGLRAVSIRSRTQFYEVGLSELDTRLYGVRHSGAFGVGQPAIRTRIHGSND